LAQTCLDHKTGGAKIEPLGIGEQVGIGVVRLASLSSALEPLDKQLLDEVARHPLLTAKELATVLQSTPWYLEARLEQLARWKLIEAYAFRDPKHLVKADDQNESPTTKSSNQVVHYLIGMNGIRYLAAVAGFDSRAR